MSFLQVLSLSVGLLMSKPEESPEQPSRWCSAQAMRWQGQIFLSTAKHCLHENEAQIWIPEFQGQASNMAASRWEQRLTQTYDEWERHPVLDIAWRSMNDQPDLVSWMEDDIPEAIALWPELGELFHIKGYPEGQGPYRNTCAFLGFELVSPSSHQRLARAALRCDMDDRLWRAGWSGTGVLDGAGRLRGWVVATTHGPNRERRLSVEWLAPGWPDTTHWPREGLPYIAPWSNDVHRMNVEGASSIASYQIYDHNGVLWNQGGPL